MYNNIRKTWWGMKKKTNQTHKMMPLLSPFTICMLSRLFCRDCCGLVLYSVVLSLLLNNQYLGRQNHYLSQKYHNILQKNRDLTKLQILTKKIWTLPVTKILVDVTKKKELYLSKDSVISDETNVICSKRTVPCYKRTVITKVPISRKKYLYSVLKIPLNVK